MGRVSFCGPRSNSSVPLVDSRNAAHCLEGGSRTLATQLGESEQALREALTARATMEATVANLRLNRRLLALTVLTVRDWFRLRTERRLKAVASDARWPTPSLLSSLEARPQSLESRAQFH